MGKVKEGEATFWRTSRFRQVAVHDVMLREVLREVGVRSVGGVESVGLCGADVTLRRVAVHDVMLREVLRGVGVGGVGSVWKSETRM